MGQVVFYVSLIFGIFFFFSAFKYYSSVLLVIFGSRSSKVYAKNDKSNEDDRRERILNYFSRNHLNSNNREGNANGKRNGGEAPFISIHLPFYNEKNVAKRIIQACMNITYPNFEIVVVDDSNDETIEILKEHGHEKWPHVLKIVHRKDRLGFKGGALNEALQIMNPDSDYIIVFDADFIPPAGIIDQFLLYFNEQATEGDSKQESLLDVSNGNSFIKIDNEIDSIKDERISGNKIAVVQGYQLHYLNKRENWITRGVRAEFSGSYMIERVAEEFTGAMKMISGSVFMIRADIARKMGWSTSITEDWELTLRIYLSGYKVLYTPLIQAPAEIPTTIRRLIRQRMRWAEGHTHCVRKQFWNVLRSSSISFREKIEFLYFAPYYLQSLFLLVGTACWALSVIFLYNPQFWSVLLGWSLILFNFFALPLMALSGLYLEKSALEDFKGVLSLMIFGYIMAPFQAYAAIKGLIEKKEGTWIRTLKTGRITDKILQIKLRRLMRWVLPRRSASKKT